MPSRCVPVPDGQAMIRRFYPFSGRQGQEQVYRAGARRPVFRPRTVTGQADTLPERTGERRYTGRPGRAGGDSSAAFALGAMIPLLPYLTGLPVLGVSLAVSALAAFIGGGIVARLTIRPFWCGAVRQLALGTAAAAVTFGIGHLVGTVVS